ncbi:kinesin-like protein KIN-14P isoform X2 [Papaver somniferum]|uniref:kinesin-like protein KIN-14P isoform X2 n=1 Tax=Papaver somniferum TaxID=3469 RepID=UPI000E6FE536|nr:kinesin-like protein KIN-14P isoform X2 [Papaver somniferum]
MNKNTLNDGKQQVDLVEDNFDITSSNVKVDRFRKNSKPSERRLEGSGSQVYPLSRLPSFPVSAGESRKSPLNLERVICSPVMPEPSASLNHHAGHKFHEVFQLKQGCYADLPAASISEMMKSSSLDNAPTQSLLSVVNGILDESIDRKNGEIPHRVACLLRKVVQEIERRISAQAEHIRTQNNTYKAREEKYQSRIRVLETLATGSSDETQVARSLQKDKNQTEERNKLQEQLLDSVIKEKFSKDLEISALKDELDVIKKKYEQYLEAQANKNQHDLKESLKCNSDLEISALKQELEISKKAQHELEEQLKSSHELEIAALKQELEITKKNNDQWYLHLESHSKEAQHKLEERLKSNSDLEISALKQELELTKKKYEQRCLHMEEQAKKTQNEWQETLKGSKDLEVSKLKQELKINKEKHEQRCQHLETLAKETQIELEKRLKELQCLLEDSKMKEKKLESASALKARIWYEKEHTYRSFTDSLFQALQDVRSASQDIKQEVVNTQMSYTEEFHQLREKFKVLADAAENCNKVIAENIKLHNEIQDLKGSIRVYCRIRPSSPGQSGKKTCIDYIGENGEMSIENPNKLGKERRRNFKFNKVFGPSSTQEEVYLDTQPLIRSVLDGYNVCIFAYGQTGSGKTYTMSGPNNASKDEWGVNYRALNDLFDISWKRRSTFSYEISVQMVEIYNEQVRDLLSEGSHKRLEIRSSVTQQNGLAVPGASMHTVQSTADVLELMHIGLNNRAVSATAMNERSSRSHSIVTVHVQAKDLKSGSAFRGSLHLVDLAGSERIDRSEVTGDRLKEAQHINKSLSSLGDVIFALAQKSPHVPYRNSKLTQVLQNSLGGQAKTLMFVQLNPKPDSYSETLSTLKFAERVSGVELGAAQSNKEGKDVRELMEQVASLKDTIAKKDEEIEHLQLLKDLSNAVPSSNSERKASAGGGVAVQHGNRLLGEKGLALPDRSDKAAYSSDQENNDLDHADSHHSMEDHAEEKTSDPTGMDADGSTPKSPVGDSQLPADSIENPEGPSRIRVKQTQTTSPMARASSSAALSRVSSPRDSPLKVSKSSSKIVATASSTKNKGWK